MFRKIKFLKNILVVSIILGVLSNSMMISALAAPAAGGLGTESGAEAAASTAAGTAMGENIAVIAPALTAILGISVLCEDIFSPATISICLKQAPQSVIDAQTAFNTGVVAASAIGSDIRAKGSLLSRIIAFAEQIGYILLKKVILDRLVSALIDWINQDGKGGIIESWDQFFADAGQNAIGTFAQGLGAGFLCKPFNLQLQLVLLPVNTFDTVSCTLNDIIGNINGFLGDFRNGSWLAYQETWYPRNNFYGGTIIAMDAAASGAAAARAAAESEAAAGMGWRSYTKDGFFISSIGTYKKIGSGCKVESDCYTKITEQNYTGIRYVKETRTLTPGALAANATVESLVTAPMNRIIHADDMAVYLTAIIDASINRLTIAGIDGLKGLVGRNTPNDLDKVNFANPCAGLTGSGFSSCLAAVNAENSSLRSAQSEVISVTTSSLPTRVEVATTLNQAIELQGQLVDAMTILSTQNPDSITTANDLATEQLTLDDLLNKLADNQTFIDAMFAQIDQVNSAADTSSNSAVTPQDWNSLSNSVDISFINDEQVANALLVSAKSDLQTVTDNVNARLPAIEAQLEVVTPPTTP